ncbi:MAG: hypothetical protein ABL308_09440 [Oceanicaulis sp.]
MTDVSFEQLCELFGYTPKNRPLSTIEVAEMLGTHEVTVAQYRLRGTGPRYFSPEGTRRVWYSERDVLAWMYSGRRHSTSEQPGDRLDPQTAKTPARSTHSLGAA